MTPELFALLQLWLEDGSDTQKAHAKRRLNLPDALEYRPVASIRRQKPTSQPTVRETWDRLQLVKTCRYRSTRACGCSGARCALRFAQPEHFQIVSVQHCLSCVAKYGDT